MTDLRKTALAEIHQSMHEEYHKMTDEIKSRGGEPVLTFEQYVEARRCHDILKNTPRMSDLAKKWGVSARTIVNSMGRTLVRTTMPIFKT